MAFWEQVNDLRWLALMLAVGPAANALMNETAIELLVAEDGVTFLENEDGG